VWVVNGQELFSVEELNTQRKRDKLLTGGSAHANAIFIDFFFAPQTFRTALRSRRA
jgi:hypothetical protein